MNPWQENLPSVFPQSKDDTTPTGFFQIKLIFTPALSLAVELREEPERKACAVCGENNIDIKHSPFSHPPRTRTGTTRTSLESPCAPTRLPTGFGRSPSPTSKRIKRTQMSKWFFACLHTVGLGKWGGGVSREQCEHKGFPSAVCMFYLSLFCFGFF